MHVLSLVHIFQGCCAATGTTRDCASTNEATLNDMGKTNNNQTKKHNHVHN